jgi:hypothetical protein
MPVPPKDLKILFDPVKDGWSTYDFHRKCDNHSSPTITLIKSAAGKIFGGFRAKRWSPEKFDEVNPTFVFSLD